MTDCFWEKDLMSATSDCFNNSSGTARPGITVCSKVHIFWEGHKILKNFHCNFVRYYIEQINGGDLAKICGLLRIYELYCAVLGGSLGKSWQKEMNGVSCLEHLVMMWQGLKTSGQRKL